MVLCNLRLLASSTTKEESEEILNSLKSSFNQFDNTLGNSLKWDKKKKGTCEIWLKILVLEFLIMIMLCL